MSSRVTLIFFKKGSAPCVSCLCIAKYEQKSRSGSMYDEDRIVCGMNGIFYHEK
jgi:hypothetical protein